MKNISKENCPKCGKQLEVVNKNELYCSECLHYKIDGVWKHVWCDEYHRHHSGCLVEIKELNKAS